MSEFGQGRRCRVERSWKGRALPEEVHHIGNIGLTVRARAIRTVSLVSPPRGVDPIALEDCPFRSTDGGEVWRVILRSCTAVLHACKMVSGLVQFSPDQGGTHCSAKFDWLVEFSEAMDDVVPLESQPW